MSLTIKCACGYPDCEARIVISEGAMLYIYEIVDKGSASTILLPPPIAKAIRDAVKAMEDNHDH